MLGASAIEYREIELGPDPSAAAELDAPGTYYSLPKAIEDIRAFVGQVEPDWMIFSEPQSLLLCSHILPSVPKALYLHNKPECFLTHVLGGAMRRRIKRLICVSDFVAACARKTPLRHAELAVVHNGIAAPPEDWPISSQLPVRLGIVGGLSPQKRDPYCLRRRSAEAAPAAGIVSPRHRAATGRGRYARAVEAKIGKFASATS